jgi:hypothetical protein
MQSYQSSEVRQDAEDYLVHRKLRDMNQRWYCQSRVAERGFPTFESVVKANWESVAERYKEHFALFWGNIHSVGHGMTSLDDSSYELSGVVDNWRNPKPVVFDVLAELNRPLQINLWLRPAALYAPGEITFDATLANENRRLASGVYPLVLKLVDSQNRVVLTKEYHHQTGTDPIEFLLFESLPLAVEPGLYALQFELLAGPSYLSAKRPVQVFERKPASLNIGSKVWVWEKGDQLQRWLRQRQVATHAGDLAQVLPRDLLIVDELTDAEKIVSGIQRAVRQGARAIVLRPEAVLGRNKPPSLSFSPLLEPVIGEWKPELREITWWGSPGAWGYSRTALALKHPFLEGLPQAVALEAQPAYQRVAPKFTWLMTGAPELANVDSAVVESSLHVDAPYTADLFSIASGKGTLVLNTLHLAENLNSDPAADRILENILQNLGRR